MVIMVDVGLIRLGTDAMLPAEGGFMIFIPIGFSVAKNRRCRISRGASRCAFLCRTARYTHHTTRSGKSTASPATSPQMGYESARLLLSRSGLCSFHISHLTSRFSSPTLDLLPPSNKIIRDPPWQAQKEFRRLTSLHRLFSLMRRVIRL